MSPFPKQPHLHITAFVFNTYKKREDKVAANQGEKKNIFWVLDEELIHVIATLLYYIDIENT